MKHIIVELQVKILPKELDIVISNDLFRAAKFRLINTLAIMNSSKYIYLRTFGQNNESGIDRCTWSTQKRIVLHFRKDWDGRNLDLECV